MKKALKKYSASPVNPEEATALNMGRIPSLTFFNDAASILSLLNANIKGGFSHKILPAMDEDGGFTVGHYQLYIETKDDVTVFWLTEENNTPASETRQAPLEYVYESDGVTCWVHSTKTGETVGRFGKMGIDIHHPFAEQDEKGQCLHCTHEPTNQQDWDFFRSYASFHWNLDIPSDSMHSSRFESYAQ